MAVEWKTPKDAGKSYENPLLSWLDSINDNLEENSLALVNFLNQISSEGEALSQSAVDVACEWASCKTNQEIERLRQKVVKGLYKQNRVIQIVVAPAQVLYNFYKNPLGAIEGAIKMIVKILGVLYAPVMAFIEFMSDLTKEIARLAKNLATIVNTLPPRPINPKINFNKFQIKVGSIGMNTITEDPSNLPSPEEMYPQTAPTPFISKKFWDAVGEDTRTAFREEPTFITGSYEERMGVGVPRRTTIDETDTFGEGIYTGEEIEAKTPLIDIAMKTLDQSGSVFSSTSTLMGNRDCPAYSSLSGELLGKKARNVIGTTGYCLRGVKKSLQAAYGTTLDGLGEAWQAADALRGNPVNVGGKMVTFKSLANKFTEVQVSRDQLKGLPTGSIIVWNRNVDDNGNLVYGGKGVSVNGRKYGHIEISLGNGYGSSDHIETIKPYRDAEYTVFLPT